MIYSDKPIVLIASEMLAKIEKKGSICRDDIVSMETTHNVVLITSRFPLTGFTSAPSRTGYRGVVELLKEYISRSKVTDVAYTNNDDLDIARYLVDNIETLMRFLDFKSKFNNLDLLISAMEKIKNDSIYIKSSLNRVGSIDMYDFYLEYMDLVKKYDPNNIITNRGSVYSRLGIDTCFTHSHPDFSGWKVKEMMSCRNFIYSILDTIGNRVDYKSAIDHELKFLSFDDVLRVIRYSDSVIRSLEKMKAVLKKYIDNPTNGCFIYSEDCYIEDLYKIYKNADPEESRSDISDRIRSIFHGAFVPIGSNLNKL